VIEIAEPTDLHFSSLTPLCVESAGCQGIDLDPSAELVAQDDAGIRYRLGPVVIDEADIARAEAVQMGGAGSSPATVWAVSYELSTIGTEALALATRAATTEPSPRDRLAIVVDGVVVSAPEVQTPITSGNGVIDGGFTEQQARALASALTATTVSS
jgi:preprotein translocase subunit SecD